MKKSFFVLMTLSLFVSMGILADDTNLQGIKFGDGDVRPALQSSTTQGVYGLKIPLKNCGTSTWVPGNLIVANNTAPGCAAKAGATTDLTTWVGIADGTVLAGDRGYVVNKGYAVALTTGTVNIGQTLVSTSSAAGFLTGNATPTTGADVGIALSTGVAAGGSTLILLR